MSAKRSILSRVAAAFLACAVIGASAAPVRADEGARYAHEWQRHHAYHRPYYGPVRREPPRVVALPPPMYYVPPPVVVAPPPMVYEQPGVSLSLTLPIR